MHAGTLLYDMTFSLPYVARFFNHNSTTMIVACRDGVYLVDVITQTALPFSDTPQGGWYNPQSVSFSGNDGVVVVGNWSTPYSVCGYDTASRTRMWIFKTAREVGAVCTHHAQVLMSVYANPTLVLELNTGTHIAEMRKAEGSIYGLGVIEGVCFIFFLDSHILIGHTSVYLATLQHLLYKQAKSLRLPLEMWDWIEKYQL
jgi:hypothetical protein